MSDLSLVRYLGYAALPEAAALRTRLEAEQAAHLAHGIHLIVAQGADGSLIVGDSHDYAATPDPFASERSSASSSTSSPRCSAPSRRSTERWIGTYASGRGTASSRRPPTAYGSCVVTSGTGASTGFALAEEVIADLIDQTAGAAA